MAARSQTIIEGYDPDGPFAGLILPERFRKRQSETRFKQNWSLSPAQYLRMLYEKYDMRRKEWVKMPRRQRGSIMLAVFGTPQPSGRVTLNGPKIFTDFVISPGSARCEVEFQSDGELWENNDNLANAEYPGEWWSDEAETGIGNSYDARALSGGTGSWTVAAASDDTWIQMNVNRAWNVFRAVIGTNMAQRTFEIGATGAASAKDSASITCSATVDI